jgi:hypothetical protein
MVSFMSSLPSIEPRVIPVKEICAKRGWYKVNIEYQREADIWSGDDKKYLIDSLLKGFDIPKIYLREMPDNFLEIVDGQQRIDTILKFRDDKITLSFFALIAIERKAAAFPNV